MFLKKHRAIIVVLLLSYCVFSNAITLQDLPHDYNGIIFIYSHGIGDSAKQVLHYIEAQLVRDPYKSFNYADSLEHEKNSGNSSFFAKLVGGNYTHTALAQELDIQELKKSYDYVRSNWPQAQIILVGMSRGAATIYTFESKYPLENVVAIITDSSFDQMGSIIDYNIIAIGLNKFLSHDWCQGILEKIFGKYKRDGISPICAIESSSCSIPHLTICSTKDNVIPHLCTINLYNKLRKIGHNKIHIFIAQDGAHGRILESSERENYQRIVHAFYKHYDLPHDEKLALEGSQLFIESQPNFIK